MKRISAARMVVALHGFGSSVVPVTGSSGIKRKAGPAMNELSNHQLRPELIPDPEGNLADW